MLLDFVKSERGIEANPKKISAIMDMGPIKNLKGVRCVTGCLTAPSRFIHDSEGATYHYTGS
jgi:hypothetical protein